MVNGIVKNWLTSYGFITGDDGKEYFAHTGDIQGAESLSAGQKVEFDSESGPKGLKAKKIKIVTGEAAPAAEETAEKTEEAPAEEESAEETKETPEEAPEEKAEEESEEAKSEKE